MATRKIPSSPFDPWGSIQSQASLPPQQGSPSGGGSFQSAAMNSLPASPFGASSTGGGYESGLLGTGGGDPFSYASSRDLSAGAPQSQGDAMMSGSAGGMEGGGGSGGDSGGGGSSYGYSEPWGQTPDPNEPTWAPVASSNLQQYTPGWVDPSTQTPPGDTTPGAVPATPFPAGTPASATAAQTGTGTNTTQNGQIPAGYGGTTTQAPPDPNLSWGDQAYWDPSSYARGYQHVLDQQGLGNPWGNPASQFAQSAGQRGYASFLLNAALGSGSPTNTQQSINDFVSSGGGNLSGGLQSAASQMLDVYNAALAGNPLPASDPRTATMNQLIAQANSNPQAVATLFANALPRTVGSGNMGSYLYQAAMQHANASGNATSANFLQSLLQIISGR